MEQDRFQAATRVSSVTGGSNPGQTARLPGVLTRQATPESSRRSKIRDRLQRFPGVLRSPRRPEPCRARVCQIATRTRGSPAARVTASRRCARTIRKPSRTAPSPAPTRLPASFPAAHAPLRLPGPDPRPSGLHKVEGLWLPLRAPRTAEISRAEPERAIIGLQMHRHVMQVHANIPSSQAHECLAVRKRRRLALEPDDVEMKCGPVSPPELPATAGAIRQRAVITQGERIAALDIACQTLELARAECCLDVGHPVVEAEQLLFVVPGAVGSSPVRQSQNARDRA